MDTLHVDMDGYKVGPGGQTLRELKQDVRDCRAAFLRSLAVDGIYAPECVRLLEIYESAQSLLNAAYVRMGLPYEAP